MDLRNLIKLKEEIIFDFWCNIGLIATSNFLNNFELVASSKTKEIKTYLLNVKLIQFHWTINELLVPDE